MRIAIWANANWSCRNRNKNITLQDINCFNVTSLWVSIVIHLKLSWMPIAHGIIICCFIWLINYKRIRSNEARLIMSNCHRIPRWWTFKYHKLQIIYIWPRKYTRCITSRENNLSRDPIIWWVIATVKYVGSIGRRLLCISHINDWLCATSVSWDTF